MLAVPSPAPFNSLLLPEAGMARERGSPGSAACYNALSSLLPPADILALHARAGLGSAGAPDILVAHPRRGLMLVAVVAGKVGFSLREGEWMFGDAVIPDPTERLAEQGRQFAQGMARAGFEAVPVRTALWFPDLADGRGLPLPGGVTAWFEGGPADWTAVDAAWPEQTTSILDVLAFWRMLFPTLEWPSGPAPVVVASSSAAMPEDAALLRLLHRAVDNTVGGRTLRCAGIVMCLDDLVHPERLLPALLIAAALRWAPVVVSRQGQGGFSLRLQTRATGSALGYAVGDVSPASPMLMLMPVLERLRRCEKANGEFILDELVVEMAIWLHRSGYDVATMALMDLQVD